MSIISELREGLEDGNVVLSREQADDPNYAARPMAIATHSTEEVSGSPPVDLFSFDEDYLRRLSARDPATEAHFVSYFSRRLEILLLPRRFEVEKIIQETLHRVWIAIDLGAIHDAKRLGSYVQAVCKTVLSEQRPQSIKESYWLNKEQKEPEPNLESLLREYRRRLQQLRPSRQQLPSKRQNKNR